MDARSYLLDRAPLVERALDAAVPAAEAALAAAQALDQRLSAPWNEAAKLQPMLIVRWTSPPA